MTTLTIRRPDDWHLHLRDGAVLRAVLPETTRHFARAIIMQPSNTLADEPTGNLDRASGKEVIQTIENLNRGGMTVVMVTHDPDIGRRTDRQIRMEDGHIITDSGEHG